MMQDFVKTAKQGKRESFDYLITNSYEKMLYTATMYVKSADIAKDVVQDASIIIFENINSLKDNSKFEPWAVSIVKNLSLLYLRQNKINQDRFVSIDEKLKEQLSDTEPQNEVTISLNELNTMIEKLPQGYKAIFNLYAIEGKSHKEISQIMNIAPHSSSSQYYRARRMLQVAVRTYQNTILPILLIIAIVFPTMKLLIIGNKNYIDKHLNITKIDDNIANNKINLYSVKNKQIVNAIDTTTNNYIFDTCNNKQIIDDQITKTVIEDNINYKNDTLNYIPNIFTTDKHLTKWQFSIGYSYNNAFNSNMAQLGTINDIMPSELQTISLANAQTWQDIEEFLATDITAGNENENENENEQKSALLKIIISNVANNSPLLEVRKLHLRPKVFNFMASKSINNRFSLGFGLEYSMYKSIFSAGWQMAYINKEQTLQFIGFKLQPEFIIYENKKFSLQTYFGTTYNIPVNCNSHTIYGLNEKTIYEKRENLSTKHTVAMNFGLAFMYNLNYRTSIYFAPSINHFIYNNKNISTFTIDNSLIYSCPIGISIKW